MLLPIALAAAASLATLFVPNAARALTWNWSATGPVGSAQGTFTTAGTTAQAGVTETITGVTGTYTRSNTPPNNTIDNGTYTITGLSSFQSADNTFKWDGSNASLLIANNNGILFSFANTNSELNIFPSSAGYGAVAFFGSTFSGNDGVITSSTLVPQQPQQDVPGPLPLLGAGAAFTWSRRLRRRPKTGSVPSASSFKTASLPSVLSPLA